ncbi:MAG: AbrB family transcriptional regulator [Oscillospiraceae bacterium]
MQLVQLLFTLLVAVAGGLLAQKIKVPAGAMIGAMVAVAALNIATGQAYLPTEVKVAVQIIAGLFIGVGIRKKDVLALRRVIVPAVLAVVSVIALTLGMGLLLCRFTDYDLVTSLFSCAPGGLVDMTLISYDMGADTSVVSVLQLVRLISVMALFPPVISQIVKHHTRRHLKAAAVLHADMDAVQGEEREAAGGGLKEAKLALTENRALLEPVAAAETAFENLETVPYSGAVPAAFHAAVEKTDSCLENKARLETRGNTASAEEQTPEPKPAKKRGMRELFITLVVGGVSGLIGYLTGIPAGTIVFAMVGVAIQNIFFDNAYMPVPVKTGAQICSGALIGVGITFAAVLSLQYAVLPALAFLVGYLLISMVMSLVLYRFTDLDIGTAFFCCAPGGLSDLTLIAGDLGADVAKVTIFQLLRSVSVIAFYPMIISALMTLFPGL